MKNRIAMRLLSILLCFVMLVGLMPTSVFAAGTKLETPQNLKLQGTVLSWDAVDNADFYGITLYHPNYVYSIGSWQTDGTSINLYKYLKDGETYGATVIACSNGSYQISTPAEIPLTACTNAGVPIYRDVNVVNGTSSASTAYPGMSVRLEAKPAPDGMVFDRWELSGGYINIGYSDTDTTIYVQAICDNDISARATYKYQENVTSAFTVQPQGGAALVGESFDVTYAMNFTPQGTVKVQVEGNTPGDFTDLKQGEIDSASIKEDSVVTKTFRIMASDGTRNIYSDEFVVSWEDGPRFVSQPMGGTVDHNVDFVATYALNFTPFSCRVERYNDYLGQWSELSFASATQATISSYDFNTSSIYRIKAIIEGGGEVYSDEFTVTWSDAVSKFIQQPVGGIVGLDEDFTFTFAINFTPVSNVAIQKYNSGFDSWDTVSYCTSLTSGTISGFASETTNKYRLEAYENGTPIHSNEFTVTWEGTDYTVSFAANGGSGTMADENNVSGEYTLPACGFTAPNGQRFKAWLVGGNEKAVGDKITVTANTTVTAVWENIPVTYYTVTFDSNGGSAVTAQTIEEGQKATKPADPTKAYYAFDGWYSDSNLTQAFDFNTPITGDTTIYAKWDVVITAANATVTVPVAGEHPDFNPISGDSSRYTVAFETWYLHESPYPDLDANSVFEHGKYYSLRIRFTPKAGYQFDSNTVFTVNGKATTSFGGIGAREYSATAYAATYTVTYDANGGTGSMAQEFLTHDNDGFAKNYTFPQCGFTSPAGQEFDKWLWYYESNPGSTNEITPGQSPWIYGNIVVKALWKTAEYNVTVTGGTASVGAGTPITKATMGTTVTLIAGQAPAGQEFDKWVVNGVVVDDANNATTTFVMPAGNVSATATYKNISVGNHPVTIAMKDGDDVNSAYTDVQNLALELLAYKGLLVEDAQVTGFRNNAGKLLFTMNNNFIVLQDGLTEQDYIHYTLTPQEVAEIKSYYGADITEVHLTFPSKCVVSFETNGGSSVSKLNLYIGDKVTKPADPTKPYFALAGWYSDSGLTQAFDFNQPITGDITLYAKWTPSPVGGMFLMTIDFNGGTSTMPTVGEVPANSGIYLNDNLGNFVTPPSGKVLAGYEIDGVPYAAGGDYLVTQNFTLKFLWKDAPVTTYTVSFNANGGSGTMTDVTGISGEYTLPSNGFTAPNGKKFKAWSVGGVEKAVGDKITVTADTTVTAVWETIPVGHNCDIKPAQKVEPSCTEGGKEAYYKCEGCGKFYEDALGAKEITDLAAWGNIAKNGHTESDWKSDKDNHWKECTVAACGVIIENSKAAHADANNDGKCDTCEYNVGTTTTNPDNKPSDDTTKPEDTNKPSDDVQSPQTGDNSMMWLWVALLFVSGFGVVATTVIGKKKSSAK